MKFKSYLLESIIIHNSRDPRLEKIYWELKDNYKNWELNFGLSDNMIIVYDSKGKVAGYLSFDRLFTEPEVLTAKFDIRGDIKDKVVVLRKLVVKFFKEVRKMSGLKYFKAEYATKEGRKGAEIIASRLGLEII
jgi:hypothetical protein